ncbi:hypothetical protein PybrP1_001446 [[Pythium] brassicae (nom. inval.)]|nr:hypothetical protein PybrP1_001446 [[Pythium] brassicae (nom. inval.)]
MQRASKSGAAFRALESPPPSAGREHERPRRQQIGDVQELTRKERVQAFLDGKIGIALEMLNVLLSMVLVAVSVVDSYDEMAFTEGNATYSQFELICTLLFAMDFTLHLFASDDRFRLVMSPMGIIDILTIIPPLITYFLASLQLDILQLVRVARVFRMLAVLRLYRIVQSYRGFEYELGVLGFMIFALIFVAAGVFQILDESYYKSINSKLDFHQAIYFVFVTMSTVGFGDITPKTPQSQLFVIVMIIVVITVIPRQINRLVELSKMQGDYMHSYTLRKRGSVQNGGHVVVAGHVSFESVSEFLAEFYRSRQGRVNMDVVFLTDVVPSERLQEVLLNVKYRRRTTYLKGSLLVEKDAKRARVEEAAAVFILAAKDNPKHADAADALTILQALAIDKLRFENRLHGADLGQRRERDLRCFLQILSPQRMRGLRAITGVEVALNTPRMRTAILARSIVCPGATALLLNLVYSASERDVDEAKASNVPWVAEYAHGLQHQIFPVFLPSFYDGMLFETAAALLYNNFHIVFVAVYDKIGVHNHGMRVSLCPFGQALREDEIGFFIAPSASFANHAVEKLSSRELGNRPRVNSRLPTLVFSSDTVLDRQSMVSGRSPSIDMMGDVDELDEKGAEELDARAIEDELAAAQGVNLTEIDSALARRRTRSRAKSTDSSSSSSASSSSSSSSAEPSSLSVLAHSTMLPPFSRTHEAPVARLQRTSSMIASKSLQRLRDHIVICGPFAHGHQIACYIEALYQTERVHCSGRARMPTVLLLVKRFPSDSDFENLPSPLPPNVFVEKGVSQNVEDLLRVRAFQAKAVLMIPGHWKYHVDELREESFEELSHHLIDYQVIMSTLSLQTAHDLHLEYLRGAHVDGRAAKSKSTERDMRAGAPSEYKLMIGCSVVRSHDSIKYFAYKSSQSHHGLQRAASASHKHFHSNSITRLRLGPKAAAHHEDLSGRDAELLLPPAFAPSYAAGEIFVDSVLDTLLCQSFFNPYVIDLIQALAGDYHSYEQQQHCNRDVDVDIDHLNVPKLTANPRRQSQHRQEEAGEEEAEAAASADAFRRPVLSTASVTRELEGESFRDIFARALQQGVLVLGIYRRANDPRRGNSLPYVFTCPGGDAEHTVEHGDSLHVLSRQPLPVRIR